MNWRLALTVTAVVTLYTLVLATPALSAEQTCTTRPLVQGSGSVRICEVRR